MSGERDHEIYRRRNARNVLVGLGLGALVLLVFAVTIVKMRDNVINPMAEEGEARLRYRDEDQLEAREAAARGEAAVTEDAEAAQGAGGDQ